mmetsp:Transcript_25227/g.25445  ORF Transcript_25227/g.25445 Transcript_25227/m.25445 type:complete len:223 (+) Transcript_25227:199-867(+)
MESTSINEHTPLTLFQTKFSVLESNSESGHFTTTTIESKIHRKYSKLLALIIGIFCIFMILSGKSQSDDMLKSPSHSVSTSKGKDNSDGIILNGEFISKTCIEVYGWCLLTSILIGPALAVAEFFGVALNCGFHLSCFGPLPLAMAWIEGLQENVLGLSSHYSPLPIIAAFSLCFVSPIAYTILSLFLLPITALLVFQYGCKLSYGDCACHDYGFSQNAVNS